MVILFIGFCTYILTLGLDEEDCGSFYPNMLFNRSPFFSMLEDSYDNKCWVKFVISISIINLLISAYFITFSILSIVNYDLFSKDILNKCGLIYGKDYNIEGGKISNILIMVVAGLYGTDFILYLISLILYCFPKKEYIYINEI